MTVTYNDTPPTRCEVCGEMVPHYITHDHGVPWRNVTAADLGDHPLNGTGDTVPSDVELFDHVHVCTIVTPLPLSEFVKLCQAIDKTFGGDTYLRGPDLYARRRAT